MQSSSSARRHARCDQHLAKKIHFTTSNYSPSSLRYIRLRPHVGAESNSRSLLRSCVPLAQELPEAATIRSQDVANHRRRGHRKPFTATNSRDRESGLAPPAWLQYLLLCASAPRAPAGQEDSKKFLLLSFVGGFCFFRTVIRSGPCASIVHLRLLHI